MTYIGLQPMGAHNFWRVWPRQAAVQELGEKVRIKEAVPITSACNSPGQPNSLLGAVSLA